MDVIRQLAHLERRGSARDELAAMGRAAVAPLLRELWDPRSPVKPWEIEFVLAKRIGAPAYDDVLAALVAAPDEERRGRARRVFTGLGTAERYIEELAHPCGNVRDAAVQGLQSVWSLSYGRRIIPELDVEFAVDALIPLLGDPVPAVADHAQNVLSLVGPEVLAPLRAVREHGPGRLRARALTVLAAAGGENALSIRDRAAVERLIRVKLQDDQAQPLDAGFTSWIAVPGGEQEAVVKRLGLWAARPVTFALGRSAGAHDSRDGAEYGRVHVTPQVDGWTLVLGPWCNPVDPERAADVLDLVTELSARHGRAHAYYFGEQGDGSGWLIAEEGRPVRRFCATWSADDDVYTLGDPLPAEEAHRARLADGERWTDRAGRLAPELAAELSVSPYTLGPHTEVHGTGLLALTPHARVHGVPRTGAYRI